MPFPAHPEDLDLARRCAAGDREALTELVERHGPLIRAAAYRILGRGTGEAEDVAAEALLRLLGPGGALASYRGEASLRTYLFVLTRRLALDALRKSRRAKREADPGLLDWVPARPDETDEENQDRIRQRAWLPSALGRLGPRDRQVLAMRFQEGLPYQEMARRLGAPIGTVASWTVRARERLRRLWEEENRGKGA